MHPIGEMLAYDFIRLLKHYFFGGHSAIYAKILANAMDWYDFVYIEIYNAFKVDG